MALAAVAALTTLSLLGGCVLAPSLPTGSAPTSTQPAAPSQYVNPSWTFPSTPSAPQTDLPSIVAVVAEVRPAVVSVVTEMVAYDLFNQAYTQEAAGSGVVIDEAGYIVTNNHVVEGARAIQIELNDGTTYPASIVGTDVAHRPGGHSSRRVRFVLAPLGTSGDLAVGEWVVAIGNALGEGISASQGIVSRLNVSITVNGNTLRDLVSDNGRDQSRQQWRTARQHGGEVIGISSVKVASIGVEGMSYAIADRRRPPIIQALINQGYVTRPWLGVSLYTVDPLHRPRQPASVTRAHSSSTSPVASPAADAGLQKGDVISSSMEAR